MILYGIPNCDTVKKARDWLTAHAPAHQFHDFKKMGLEAAVVEHWLRHVDWTVLVNRKGTTWRKLDPATQAMVIDAESAKALMLAQPSVIKRPVLVIDHGVHVGFSVERYQALFDA